MSILSRPGIVRLPPGDPHLIAAHQADAENIDWQVHTVTTGFVLTSPLLTVCSERSKLA
jgi:hypothetical protein